MNLVSQIGSLTKKIYRIYSSQLLIHLEQKGFSDLRPSFLEILIYMCENETNSIKAIGTATALKKQTMTSHLNELEKRGYITRETNPEDKREQRVLLTAYGEKFKMAILEIMDLVEKDYLSQVGSVEMEKTIKILENFHKKTKPQSPQMELI